MTMLFKCYTLSECDQYDYIDAQLSDIIIMQAFGFASPLVQKQLAPAGALGLPLPRLPTDQLVCCCSLLISPVCSCSVHNN